MKNSSITINCDIGERGMSNSKDLQLMNYIHIANIACGGHAGNRESFAFFKDIAEKNDVKVSAHLSYNDKSNFGRKSITQALNILLASLEEQWKNSQYTKIIKFHGALYNDSLWNKTLAEDLTVWLKDNEIEEIICPKDSYLSQFCSESGIHVLGEAFAERTYTYDNQLKHLVLTNRSKSHAVITQVPQALDQVESIVRKGTVSAYALDEYKQLIRRDIALSASTICIHSDSSIALELAKRLYYHV